MGAGPRILVVDDMPAMRSIVRNMLGDLGYSRVDEAEDGELAWAMIQGSAEQPFALIIADWNMPGMSGVDLLRATRSFVATRQVPFVMITAQGATTFLSEAARSGATGFIVKPFTAHELGERVAAALRAVHSTQQIG